MITKLQLISTYTCPFVQRARILLEEKGADYEILYIDLMDQPTWFKELSPLGTVPIMRISNNGQESILFESQVICEYLDETIEPRLHPSAALERAINRAWIEYASSITGALTRYSFCESEIELSEKLDELQRLLGRLEELLIDRGQSPFFNGEHFSITDAAYAPFATRYFVLEKYLPTNLLEHYPHVKDYLGILNRRNSVTRSIIDDFDIEYGKRIMAKDGFLARYFPNS